MVETIDRPKFHGRVIGLLATTASTTALELLF
jgi:hypothetical protein